MGCIQGSPEGIRGVGEDMNVIDVFKSDVRCLAEAFCDYLQLSVVRGGEAGRKLVFV